MGDFMRVFRTACIASVAAAVFLGACAAGGGDGDGGYLGTGTTLSETIYNESSGDSVTALSDEAGTLLVGQTDPSVEWKAVPITGGHFSILLDAPEAADTILWSALLPPFTTGGPYTISDAAAKGMALNFAECDITSPVVKNTVEVHCSNLDDTRYVYYVYTDADVTITGSGTYTGPDASVEGTGEWNTPLKAGWNRLILARVGVGSAPGYSDTWTVGDSPAGVYWWHYNILK